MAAPFKVLTQDELHRRRTAQAVAAVQLPLCGYGRISDDKKKDRGGVGRQRKEYTRKAETLGETVAEDGHYEDDDISAFHGDYRPGFERMLLDLASGKWGGLIVYKSDRLYRQPEDLMRLCTIYRANPHLKFFVVVGQVDLTTEEGRTAALNDVASNKQASLATQERVRSKHEELMYEGKRGGGRTPFGWIKSPGEDPHALKAHPVESEVLREMVKKFIAQETYGDIAAYAFDRGYGRVPVAKDDEEKKARKKMAREDKPVTKPWDRTNIRKIVTNPAIAGYRAHNGEVLGDTNGDPIRGEWEALVDEETWQKILGEMERRNNRTHTAPRKFLLSGILRCGKCGVGMYGKTLRRKKKGKLYVSTIYICDRQKGGCERVSRRTAPVEKAVIAKLKIHLAKNPEDSAEKVASTDWPNAPRLAQVLADIDELRDMFRQKEISRTLYVADVKPLEEERERLKVERGRYAAAKRKVAVVPTNVVRDFDTFSMDQKRTVIRAEFSAIWVPPVGRVGNAPFDPSLLKFDEAKDIRA